MDTLLRVGVKFCGNCNPHIPSGEIVRQIEDQATRRLPEVKFLPWQSPGLQALLLMGGCSTNCVERPQVDCPKIVVAGEMINLAPCAAHEISQEVVSILRGLLEARKTV